MRKFYHIYIIVLFLLFSLPVSATRYEGEVLKVIPADKTLVLSINSGPMAFKVAAGAKLYYNNTPATLNMYTPVTPEDYVSGYVETDESGLVRLAYFFYLVREGVLEELKDGRIMLKELESGICDSYGLKDDLTLYLNNYPAKLDEITSGMKVLLILDHHFQVKKMAVFHYDYTGFIERVDLSRQVVVVNIGTRLKPKLREFFIGGKLRGACEDWESLAALLTDHLLVQAKILVDNNEKTIYFMDTRSL